MTFSSQLSMVSMYHYWRRAFLYGGLIDIREWQKVIAAYSDYQYKAHQDPHLKILEGGKQ